MADRDLAEARYRVNGKTVEALYEGKWIVAYYCSSPEGAEKRRAKCIEGYIEHLSLSPEERMGRILR